jgi:hypothetical protein
LPVSLHCPLLIAPSVFSKIYLLMAIPEERLNLVNTFLAQICIYKKINVCTFHKEDFICKTTRVYIFVTMF